MKPIYEPKGAAKEYGDYALNIYTAYYGENRWGGIGWHKLNSKYHNCSPTHWMPLPEPPKEGGSE